MRVFLASALLVCGVAPSAAAAAPATPRELLINAAFVAPDKRAALAEVEQALAAANGALAIDPGDREARLQRAMAIGYRAKLTRTARDAKLSHRLFQQFAARYPRDPEAQLALGGWHLDAIADLGPMLAGLVLGAKKASGLAEIDRAVTLGGDRAFFRGFAAMMHIRADPHDVTAARALAEAAAAAPAPSPLDRIARRDAAAMLVPLRAGDGEAAAGLARRLLPFGDLAG